MSFLNTVGNLLKQNACKRISSVSSASSPSLSQAIRCMPSSDVTELFVGGLTEDVDAVTLMEAFSQYGSVIEARAFNNPGPGTHRGFGFVIYDTMEAASIAIQEFNGKEIQGNKIRVTFATEEPRSGSQGGGYGRGGNQGGGDGNYGGDVSNGGGNQFFSGGGGGYVENQVPLGGDQGEIEGVNDYF